MNVQVLHGDCRVVLKTLQPESVQCCVCSPPYWGLRSYGVGTENGEIGLEKTPELYVAVMVDVFREVRRVLADDGTLWLNLGDCYATGAGSAINPGGGATSIRQPGVPGAAMSKAQGMPQTPDKKNLNAGVPTYQPNRMPLPGLKPKDLCGIPWRVAFALQADGWWLRSEIIWAKPNPMPESVTDRPTKSHEQIFLLTKSASYYYDAEAIKEPAVYAGASAERVSAGLMEQLEDPERFRTRPVGRTCGYPDERNKRTVWTVPTCAYPDAHFATFPPDLIKPCILAGSRAGDTVLDPFGGSGTTAVVAEELGRRAILCELAPHYLPLIEQRLAASTPGLALT